MGRMSDERPTIKVRFPSTPIPADDPNKWIFVWKPWLDELIEAADEMAIDNYISERDQERLDRLAVAVKTIKGIV